MDNQSSNQILFPVIPENFCPQGTLADIFNALIQQYLNAGMVNIPGLGNVTPQTIAAILAQLVTLSNQIAALTYVTNTGTININSGTNTNTISFATVMPISTYSINITFIDSSGSATDSPAWALVSGSNTTSQMQIRTYNIDSAITSMIYTVSAPP